MRFMMVLAAAAVLAAPATARQIAPVMVYFDAGSDALDREDHALLDRAATRIRQTGGSMSIVLAGHADGPEGTAEETVGLSQRRANVVREYLADNGVPAGVMMTAAFGETRPAIETTGPEAANRRVEITVGPGSGW